MLSFLTIHAQEIDNADFNIMHYSDENGLPQNSVKSIMKGHYGFVWLATEDGLVRFDGRNFYTFNKSVLPVTTNRIHGFIPTLQNDDTTGSQFNALVEYNEFIKIGKNGAAKVDTGYFKTLLNYSKIARDNDGKIDIIRSFPSRFTIDRNHAPYLVPAGDARYYLWAPDKVEYYINDEKTSTIKAKFNTFFLLKSRPFAIQEDGNLVRLDESLNAHPLELAGDIVQDEAYRQNKKSYRLFWNNVSEQTFVYSNKKFFQVTVSPDNFQLHTKLILKDFDFDEHNISTFFYDPSLHYLFLGSNTKGLYVLRGKDFKVVKSEIKGADNVYYAQLSIPGNLALSAQGYLLGSATTGKIPNSLLMNKLESKYFLAMNNDGSFWTAKTKTLFKLSLSNSVVKKYNFNEEIKALYTDDKNILWVGGEKNSLFYLDTKNPSATPKLFIKAAFGEITCMLKIDDTEMLLGTKKGLFKLNFKVKNLVLIKGISSATIRSIYNSNGEIWITTYGDGFYHYKNDKIVKLPLYGNQFLAASHCIVEDKNGFFWITTNKGLFQVLKQDLLDYVYKKHRVVFYLHYDKRHGFGSNEFNGGCQPCAVKLSDGTISFPSIDGLVWFKPEEIVAELPDKNIFVSEVKLDGKYVRQDSRLEIPRDFKNLSISITTPYFNNKNNLKIEYSIQETGQHPIWIPLSGDFTIRIPNTSSGDYTLLIRKLDGFSRDNYTNKSIAILIQPAWYETWLFRSVLAISALFLFYIILKLRTSYLLKQERKKNLYRQYHINNQIVTAINHDIQTPLHFISSSFSQIQNHLDKSGHTDSFITRMGEETINTIQYARAHTSNLLNYIKTQNRSGQSSIKCDDVDVCAIIRNSCQLLAGSAGHRDVQIINHVAQEFIVYSDDKLLSVIIQNLIDNAVKLSHSSVTISPDSVDGYKIISITDTAGGMPREISDWLNIPFKSYDQWMRGYQFPDHKGLGLVIVKDICILLGIQLHAESQGTTGTLITLKFQKQSDK